MENDPLSTYLDALARDDCYRVERVLKEAPHERTEVVFFAGATEASLGPFVRKIISGDVPLGGAYRLLFEAQRAGRRFRHLPRIYDVHERDGSLIVVMEYVAGRTLREEVYERDPSPALAAELFPALCDGVAELHGALPEPIIHRDLKPSNIVVNQGNLTIIDFGIARSFRAGAECDTARFGTRSYAPPEQFGYGQTDVRSDGYALGMILYYLLTERDPSPTLVAAGFPDQEVPAALRPVLMRACAFDPAARFQTVGELKEAFLAALGMEGGAAVAPGVAAAGTGVSGVAAAAVPGVAPPVAMPGAAAAVAPGPAAAPGQPMPSAFAPMPGLEPAQSGKFWTGRTIAIVAVWALFIAVLITMPFDPDGTYRQWPLPLLMFYYYAFGIPFFTGFACLGLGNDAFARLFAPFGRGTKKQQRLVGWVLVGIGVVAVWVAASLARLLGFAL